MVHSCHMISEFRGRYYFLSNYYTCEVLYDGLVYSSAECAYQSSKVQPSDRHKYTVCSSPEAKRMGRSEIVDPNWHNGKLLTMLKIVYNKFSSNLHLLERLLETGSQELIEGNTWGDTYWGVCNGIGENNLGKILMIVHTKFQQEFQQEAT